MATRLATATATTTRLAGANGLLHLHAVADHALADTHVLADSRPTQTRRQTCLDHGLVKMTRPRRFEQNKPNAPDTKNQVRRQALRPWGVLRARPAKKQANQENKQPLGVQTKSNESDGHFETKVLEKPRPTGPRSTWVPPSVLFAEAARQQEGAS